MRVALLPCLLCSAVLLFSCKKSRDDQSQDDTKSVLIKDLAGDTGASLTDGVDGKEQRPFRVFLFKLKGQQQTWLRTAADSAQWLKTADWDLAFTGIYNSEVYANNGSITGNPGYGSTARAQVVMIDRPYAQITEAPDDATFNASGIKNIGQETSGNTAGWFNYNLSTHLVQPIKNRTFVLKLPDGKYAKLELQNVYKGNPPVVTDLYWPAPYFTFRYFIQEDGSRNLVTQ
ncbi:MAG: HmuY family protein [Chitinophagaceae bacterium]